VKKISIVTACYNEEDNVEALYMAVKDIMSKSLINYKYEHLFIDNCSNDRTVDLLRKMAAKDKNVKVIINSRNFGHIRSPVHALLQADGDAIISLVADFQDPPEMIIDLVKKWEEGNDAVLAIKNNSKESKILFKLRTWYYNLLSKLSEVRIYKNFTGFGLYSKKVMNEIRRISDPYPFFRGMIAEVGYKVALIEYTQPARSRGFSKNRFYSLYDIAILGIICNSKIPLRLAVFIGAISSFFSAMVGVSYFVAKLLFWEKINLGVAPLMIMTSFMFSILLFFIGVIGEYIGAIYTQVLNRPLVHEEERINFTSHS
jgi:glycosyltransferase involved in cell wall biosynthesis